MRIPLKFYEDLRNSINLSEVVRLKVVLIKKGVEFTGLCPFHHEKSPSFTVNDLKKFYHCFGCGAHGDVVKFVAQCNGFSYKDAAIKLANDYNIELPKLTKEQELLYDAADETLAILNKAMEFFQYCITIEARQYLKSRNVNEYLIKDLNLGFAPSGDKLINYFEKRGVHYSKLINAGLIGKREDGRIYEIFHNRIIFPIKNIYDKVVGFGGRVIGTGMPKYLNSPETFIFKKKDILYGENRALTASYKKNYVILVEGYLDVIALASNGFEETVASLGTAVSENHLKKLWKYCDEIVICLDGDVAGMRASSKVINIVLPLITNNKKISFIKLPAGKDPHDVINTLGIQSFTNLLEQRENLSMMIWNLEFLGKSFVTPEEQAALETNLENYCNQIKDRILNHSYRRFFKDQLWQNLFKSKKKSSYPLASSLKILKQSSELEILERDLCTLLIKYPEIIKNDKINDFFFNLNLKSADLLELKIWILDHIEEIEDYRTENISKLIERTSFYETYLLLLKSDKIFLNLSSDKNLDKILLWEILSKKYYLYSLKEEYAALMHNNIEQTFEKEHLYHMEILKVSQEIQQLTDSFLNY